LYAGGVTAALLLLLAWPSGANPQAVQQEAAKEAPAKPKTPKSTDTDWFVDDAAAPGGAPIAGAAAKPPSHKAAFCARSHQKILADLRSFLEGFSAALAFDNPDGTFNTGLCWLHSRYQRSASYLLHLRPDLPKPGAKALKKAVWSLADMDRVVEVGGYASLDEFSREHEAEITKALNAMANRCALSGDCLARVGDSWEEKPEALRARMEHLYERMLRAPRVIFLRTRAKDHGPLTSHSLLLLAMQPLPSEAAPANPLSALNASGYRLTAVDPNFAKSPRRIYYRFGAKSLVYGSEEPFLPYEDFDGDLPGFERALAAYCKP
jgi:hypothetical protein